jgi:ubiquinol-cytochrome c reductase cytochrome c1 subunit
MRKLLAVFALAVSPVLAFASEAHMELDSANVDLGNIASLQRGAKYFVNYCLSCHSAQYMRFNRVGHDLGLTDEQLRENLMFAAEKVGETMTVAMRPNDAVQWFGVAPPDLSVIARARGVDWLYTYLRTFYLDGTRPFGVNNLVFKDTAMPACLAELQGWQKPVYKTFKNAEGVEEKVVERLELVRPGEMSPEQYDRAVRDLVSFLAYVGEPAKLERQRVGPWVLLYLGVFLLVAYAMKREYWKDVH